MDQHIDEHVIIRGPGESEGDTPVLSIVTPAFNEELNLNEFYKQVSCVLEQIGLSWEIVFVDDGSRDHSREVLADLYRRDPRARSVIFARNFGHQIALSAGLRAARGQAVIVMDADLQHPPEMIPEMIRLWQSGFHVVHTKKDYGHKVGYFKRKLSDLFYRVMNEMSGTKIEPGAADFKLLDRRIVDLLNQMPEKTRFLRALVPWLGFKQTTIETSLNHRFAGTPSFTFKRSLNLAIDGIVSFSTKPLRWIMYLGFLVWLAMVPYGLWAVLEYFIYGPRTPGWTSLFLLNMILGGALLISLGVIGEYVGRIYEEVKQRPLFTVEKTNGIPLDRVTQLKTDESHKSNTSSAHDNRHNQKSA